MGLDITAVKIWKLKESEIDFVVDEEECGETFVYDDFYRSLRDSEKIKIYDNDGEEENKEYLGNGLSMSYGSYNQFRGALSLAALGRRASDIFAIAGGLDKNEPYPSPLYHIINFADNEGYIGPEAVKEVSVYLNENKDKITPLLHDVYKDKFLLLCEEFEAAAKVYPNGFIQFS